MSHVQIFMHVACLNNYQSIFDEIFYKINSSGLLNLCDKLNVCVVGGGNLKTIESDKISICVDPQGFTNPIESITYGEFFTLTKMKEFANTVERNTNILYCHLRGVTSPNNECIETWRKYLVHQNITKFKKCLDVLKEYDACGADLITKDRWPYADHFSGNFWWANTDHLKKLPEIKEIDNPSAPQKAMLRHNAEFWIGMVDGKFKSLCDVDVDICSRHLQKCPSEYYQ